MFNSKAKEIALIAAIANNGVIGRENEMPWFLPADLRRFKSLTYGHSVIMGRKTWEGLKKPLEQRQNIVISKTIPSNTPGIRIVGDFHDAIDAATFPSPIFAIGGVGVYRSALAVCHRLFLTEIHHDFEGDVLMPEIDKSEWKETSRESFLDRGVELDFVCYVRRQLN